MGPQSFQVHCSAMIEASVSGVKEGPVTEMLCKVQEPEKGKICSGNCRPCDVMHREDVGKVTGGGFGLGVSRATL